jgi:hypothetical protein
MSRSVSRQFAALRHQVSPGTRLRASSKTRAEDSRSTAGYSAARRSRDDERSIRPARMCRTRVVHLQPDTVIDEHHIAHLQKAGSVAIIESSHGLSARYPAVPLRSTSTDHFSGCPCIAGPISMLRALRLQAELDPAERASFPLVKRFPERCRGRSVQEPGWPARMTLRPRAEQQDGIAVVFRGGVGQLEIKMPCFVPAAIHGDTFSNVGRANQDLRRLAPPTRINPIAALTIQRRRLSTHVCCAAGRLWPPSPIRTRHETLANQGLPTADRLPRLFQALRLASRGRDSVKCQSLPRACARSLCMSLRRQEIDKSTLGGSVAAW